MSSNVAWHLTLHEELIFRLKIGCGQFAFWIKSIWEILYKLGNICDSLIIYISNGWYNMNRYDSLVKLQIVKFVLFLWLLSWGV